MQAKNPALPLDKQNGITFLADVMTTGNQPIKYLQNILNEVNGPNAGGATFTFHIRPNGGERLFDLIPDPMSGATFPFLDSNSKNPAADPTIASGSIPSPNPNSATYFTVDSPARAIIANGKNLKQLDEKLTFRMYLRIQYEDGTLYAIANWNWNVNFYGKGWVEGTGMTVIDPSSKVLADADWTRSNDDPTRTIPPNLTDVRIQIEIT